MPLEEYSRSDPCDEEGTHSLLSSYLFLFLPSAILLLRPLCVKPFSPLPSSYTVPASIAYQHSHFLDSGSMSPESDSHAVFDLSS